MQFMNSYRRVVFAAVDYLQQSSVAHNLFLTRGTVFGARDGRTTIRAFLWPRKTVTGTLFVGCIKYCLHRSFLNRESWLDSLVIFYACFPGAKCENGKCDVFNVAVAELAGHVPMYGRLSHRWIGWLCSFVPYVSWPNRPVTFQCTVGCCVA